MINNTYNSITTYIILLWKKIHAYRVWIILLPVVTMELSPACYINNKKNLCYLMVVTRLHFDTYLPFSLQTKNIAPCTAVAIDRSGKCAASSQIRSQHRESHFTSTQEMNAFLWFIRHDVQTYFSKHLGQNPLHFIPGEWLEHIDSPWYTTRWTTGATFSSEN